MAENDLIELKFRLLDGTDIGPNKFNTSTTVGSLKGAILARWPAGKKLAKAQKPIRCACAILEQKLDSKNQILPLFSAPLKNSCCFDEFNLHVQVANH